jgi:predicted nucleic acid-binding protein
MIILDTNVLSALMHAVPDAKVSFWLDRQPRTSVWTTSITVLEIRFGLQIIASGRKQSLLLESFELLLQMIDHRVAAFDFLAANEAADLMASRQKRGQPIDLRDTMIAGIVLARHAAIATRNTAHFSDISATVINPWTT